jgi:hypothetical protein
MIQEEVGWPTCQWCGKPMLSNRSNQKYCSNDNKCKQAAFNQRKRKELAKQQLALPSSVESVLVFYITSNVRYAQEIRDSLRGLLSAADFMVLNRKLTRITDVATDSDVMRIAALDQEQASQNYTGFLERTDLPP